MVQERQGKARATALFAIVAVLLAIIAATLIINASEAAGWPSPIAGDPHFYEEISDDILAGQVPYVDMEVEHLPGSLVPIVLIGVITDIFGLDYELTWTLAMAALFVGSAIIVAAIPAWSESQNRFVLLALPLLPLVVFRLEPWLILFVALAIRYSFLSYWRGGITATAIAALTKGWPIVLYTIPFRLNKRRLAITAGLATAVVLIAVVALPGFQSSRNFAGIHSETILGSIILVVSGITDNGAGLIATAGSTYVDVGSFAVILNALIGLPFLALGMVLALRGGSTRDLVQPLGVVVLGIMLASPLFSTQFVWWLVPFLVPADRGIRKLYLGVSIASLAIISIWVPDSLAWALLVLGRNIALIALGCYWLKATWSEAQGRSSAGETHLQDVS